MAKHTILIGTMYLVINVEELSEQDWWASTSYRGERIEARSDNEQGALSAILVALSSEINKTGE